MKIKDKFSILNNSNGNGIIAVREKPSVEIDGSNKQVKMHDFCYSFNEIITVGKKLEELLEKDLANVA